jgi:hypothetical protein
MCKIKLIKGRSYHGAVTATNLNPVVEVDEATARKAVASGYFALLEEPKPQGGGSEGGGEADAIGKMTVEQLEAYAAENGIDLAGAQKKADKLAKIIEAVTQNEGGGSEGGSEADFEGNE